MSQELADNLSGNLPQTRYGAQFRSQAEIPGLREYLLQFNGFDRDEIKRVARYLKLFSAYQSYDYIHAKVQLLISPEFSERSQE